MHDTMVEVEPIKGEVPSSITKALIKQQERVYLLHLEKSLVNFIKNNILQLQLLNQSPIYVIHSIYLKNSYYRLLTHQLCQYYNLQHWNNQQNEIVVSPRQNFDYGDFITHVDNPSSPKFTKLSVYIQMEMNTQHMIFSNELLSRSHSQKTQPRAPLNTAISSIRPAARQIKLIRKDKPPSSVTDTVNGEGEVSSNSATIASAKSDDTSSSSVTDMTMNMEDLAISDSSSTSTESHDSKIESDRATKEALYRKLRDEIFDQEDDIEATQGYRYILKSVPIPLKEKNPHEHGRQYGLDPDVKQIKSKDGKSQHQKNRSQNQNQNQTKTKNMSQSQSQTGNEPSLNPKPKPLQNQTMAGRTGVSFVPAYPGMSIPLQYNGGAQSGTGVISTPMVAVYPQQQQPSHGAYFGVHFPPPPPPPPPTGYYPGPVLIAPMAVPTTCNGSTVVHGPPQLVPTTTAIPSGIPPNGIYSGMSEYGNRTSYDKETARKILNNPYIIIPDSSSNVTRNKTRKRYNNTNNNNNNNNNGGINETKGK